MTRLERFSIRATALALFAGLAACSSGSKNPSGPDPVPLPGLRGTLEVRLSVTGDRPDVDGFLVVVRPAAGEPMTARVGPSGGSTEFLNLTRGDYTVEVDDLEPQCTVRRPHPRSVTLAADRTLVTFVIDCPGPAEILITTGGFGTNAGATMTVEFQSNDGVFQANFPIGANDSLRVVWDVHLDPTRNRYDVRLTGLPDGCQVTTGNPLALPPLGAGSRLERIFSVVCMRGSAIAFVSAEEVWLLSDAGLANLTPSAGTDAQPSPSLSPDGRRIVFRGSLEGIGVGLVILDIASGEMTFLTEGAGFAAVGPQAWSPDGARIVFFSGPNTFDGPVDIFVINADGTGLTQLTDDGISLDPAWSPDGRSIAFCGGADLYTMAPDGTGVTKLADLGCGPVWSPDGTQIAFTVISQDFGNSVFVIGADGGTLFPLDTFNQNSERPIWSPDGTLIGFNDRNFGMWVAPFDGAGFGIPFKILNRGVGPSWR